MIIVNILALACAVAAFICWVKAGFHFSFASCGGCADEELWFFGAVIFTSLFSAYSLIVGIADVFHSVLTALWKLSSLL